MCIKRVASGFSRTKNQTNAGVSPSPTPDYILTSLIWIVGCTFV